MNPQPPSPASDVAPDSPAAERRFHRYRGNEIPWYVHLIWVSFWLFAVFYILRYVFPAIRGEFLAPP